MLILENAEALLSLGENGFDGLVPSQQLLRWPSRTSCAARASPLPFQRIPLIATVNADASPFEIESPAVSRPPSPP